MFVLARRNGLSPVFGSLDAIGAAALKAIATVSVVIALLALSMVALPKAFAPTAPISVTHSAAAAGTTAASVPAGLEAAIHRTLGPGAIGLGHAPLTAGIAAAAGGWSATDAAQSLSASISRLGAVSVQVGAQATAGGFAAHSVGAAASGSITPLHVLSSSLSGGQLIQHMGILSTGYRTTSAGLEQTFTITHAPAHAAGALVINLGPAAGWAGTANGSALVHRAADGGSSLSYGGLATTTATGLTVPSVLRIVRGEAQIVLDVPQGATYPITVDPTWTSTNFPTATLTDSGSPGDEQGYAVAISADGTTALVGAPNATALGGEAYIFQAAGEGAWADTTTPVAYLSPPGDSPNGLFGAAVALSSDGTTALIGAYTANGLTGTAYIFHVSSEASWATTSSPTAILSAGTTNSLFGTAVALSSDGTLALIGAQGTASNTGAVDVFHVGSEGAWTSTSTPAATLTKSGGASGDLFGQSVSVSADGTTALIGASGVGGTGAAYVYQAASESSWATTATPKAILTQTGLAASSFFGYASVLSSDGTTALVGAYGVSTSTGAAYLFHVTSEAAWATTSTATAILTNGSGTTNSQFGNAVSLSQDGTIALIGAETVNSNSGAAYVFEGPSEATWATSAIPLATLTNTNYTGALFGIRVALSPDGTLALVGASRTTGSAGATSVYHVAHEGIWSSMTGPSALLTNGKGILSGDFGYEVALSADGTTAVVGAPGENSDSGVAYVFHVNNENEWVTTSAPIATLAPPTAAGSGSDFGISVSLTPDGTTALIGAPSSTFSTGIAYVFHVTNEASWASTSTPTATLAAASVAGDDFGFATTISDDGTTALVGAPFAQSGAGKTYVFQVANEGAWGTVGGPIATLTAPGTAALGEELALSADGTTALISAEATNSSVGSAYIFHVVNESAWATSTLPTATLTNSAGTANSRFGSAVDLSADGTTALIGSFGVNTAKGAAFIYQAPSEGSWATAVTPTATLTNSAGGTNDVFGYSAALSPDGTTALIGAPQAQANQGAAYVFGVASESAWGASTPLTTPTATLSVSGIASSFLGYSAALSADATTALVGAVLDETETGAAMVFHSLPTTPFISDLPASGSFGGGFNATVSTNGDGATSVTTNSPTVCTVSGFSVRYVGLGTCSLTAHVGQGNNYGPANGIAQTFVVGQGAASQPFISNLPFRGTIGGGFTATVATNGDGTKSVTSNSPGICTASGLVITYIGVGACSLTAQVANGTNWTGATGSPQVFLVVTANHGYWLVGSDGGIFTFGSANYWGSMGGIPLNRPVVGLVRTPDLGGYWLVASDGGIFSFGDAKYYGSIPGLGLYPPGTPGQRDLNAPIVAMVPSADGGGYFMVASDGGVFAFGDAVFAGSCPGLPVLKTCSAGAVGVVPDTTGGGYWVLTQTGNVYAFGDAAYFGAPGQQGTLMTSIVRTPDGGGYWILDAAGQVFSYGDAAYFGGLPAGTTSSGPNPAAAIFSTDDGGGYWVVTALGRVYAFGDAPNDGDMSRVNLNGSIIAATGF